MRAIHWTCVALALVVACNEKNGGATDGGGGSGGTTQHALSIRVSGSGRVLSSSPSFSCSNECTQTIDSTVTVQLSALPDANWSFSGWSGACSGSGTCSVTMDVDHDVTATFTAAPPPPPGSSVVTVNFTGNGSGHVTSAPSGIDCPSACSTTVARGTTLTLTAQADANSTFAGWGGACSGNGTCSVTANTDVTVWANFTANAPPPPKATVSVQVTGSGSGRVTSIPAGIDCPGACSVTVDTNTAVALTAVADTTSSFSGWGGACSGTAGCSLNVTADVTVTAHFTTNVPPPPANVLVTVKFAGTGAGTVTSTPAGINCPGTCTMMVPANSDVVLTAHPDASSTFVGWGGACSGGGDCTFKAVSDMTVWADFLANVPPPPPPPPPPPVCTNLGPGTPPMTKGINLTSAGSCAAGIGDASGSLGLQSFGTTSPMDSMRIVDAESGLSVTQVQYSATGFFVPTNDGYIGVFHFLSPRDYWYPVYWNHLGQFVKPGPFFIGQPAFAGTPFGTEAIAGPIAPPQTALRRQLWTLGPNSPDIRCTSDLASTGTVFGLGGDSSGRVLVITDGGSGNIDAQWFEPNNCVPLTGTFRLLTAFQAGANTWFETAALVGGGVAVRRVDQQNDANGRPYRTAQWLVTVPAGTVTPQPAPKWLTDRPNTNMALVRAGAAYAMLPMGRPDVVPCSQSVEVLAPDGTSCGFLAAYIAAVSCRTEDFGISLDGTPIQLIPQSQSSPGSCTFRWWPHALK